MADLIQRRGTSRPGSLVRAAQNAIERRVQSSHEEMVLQQSRFLARTLTWALIGCTGFGLAWLALAKTEEVVVAPGKLEPIGDVKTIQVPVGGVLQTMLVKDGERVSKGQVLLRLDNEATKDREQSLRKSIAAKEEQLQLKQIELHRYLDFNDGFITPKGGGHPSDMLAPLLSTAEVYGRSGRDLITAMVVSFDVACKLMDVVDMRGLGLDQATVVGPAAVAGVHAPARLASGLRCQYVRVHDIDRVAFGECHDLIEDVGELDFVFLARHVAEVRRADDIRHVEQRMRGVAQRLFLIDVDRRHAGPPGLQRCDQRARLDQASTARVDQNGGGLHPTQIVRGHDPPRRRIKPQM